MSHFCWDTSGVRAFVWLYVSGWRGSLFRLHSLFIMEELCIPRICRLLVLLGVSALTSRLLTTRGSWWGYLNTQHFVLFLESPCLVEQGLHLSLVLALVSFYIFVLVEVVFTTHNRWSTSRRCWHFVFRFPQMTPMLITGQLRMDSSLRWDRESSCSDIRI